MNELIYALQIFDRYITDDYISAYPTSCEHDLLFVHVHPNVVTEFDKNTLKEMGFVPYENRCFVSTKFGSN